MDTTRAATLGAIGGFIVAILFMFAIGLAALERREDLRLAEERAERVVNVSFTGSSASPDWKCKEIKRAKN